MRNHRTKDRRRRFRCGVFGGVSGFSVTLQNNRLGWIEIGTNHSPIRRLVSGFRVAYQPTGTSVYAISRSKEAHE